MGFKYLSNKTWSQITREERYFCSHLYHFLIGKEKEFISWLNETLKKDFNSEQKWEISFEVCFYRDYYKNFPKTKMPTKDLSKRTFDLVLFSESEIIIIEAKVQQPFKEKQINDLREDIRNLTELLVNENVRITPLLLGADLFFKNLEARHGKGVPTFITGIKSMNWMNLFQKYQLQFLQDAEEKYKK